MSGVSGFKSMAAYSRFLCAAIGLTMTFVVQAGENIKMVRIPAGSFTMGCLEVRDRGACNDDEKPAHTVHLAAFELGQYEVTQGQWKAIMGENPSSFGDCGNTCPVENVSWDDIQAFIQKLNAKTGKTYRLPSEAEWEYACRAGKSTAYCGGNKPNTVAWAGENSGEKTHPVGRKKANAFGLYDMSGNVWEWVQDSYHESYSGAPTNGGVWVDGKNKVVRGGACDLGYEPWNVRAAGRGSNDSTDQIYGIGFRLARTLQ